MPSPVPYQNLDRDKTGNIKTTPVHEP